MSSRVNTKPKTTNDPQVVARPLEPVESLRRFEVASAQLGQPNEQAVASTLDRPQEATGALLRACEA